jgi:preprotein translocase subunit Sec63
MHRTYLLVAGWIVFGLACWRASKLKVNSKVYDPFEILGINSVRAMRI